MEEVKDLHTDSQGILKRMKELYKEAFRFIDQALKMEERGKIEEAVLCYEKGIKLAKTALSLSKTGLQGRELELFESTQKKLERMRIDGEYRLEILKPLLTVQAEPSAPSLPQDQNTGKINAQATDAQWQNGRALLSIDEGVKLFHIDSQQSVSTWSVPCHLKVVQLSGDHKDHNVPPAFMQCGEWIYPLIPGKSPALKSYDRTYMFPDINLQLQNGVSASVGIVLTESVPEIMVERFERALSCYCDFRKYSIKDESSDKPLRPPPPYQLSGTSEANLPKASTMDFALVPTSHSEESKVSVEGKMEQNWSQILSNGIHIGAKWASWGLSKGAEITSYYVEKGAVKLRNHIQPNSEPATVSPEVSKNVQQVREVTGAAVQVSTFLVATLCTLTIQLGKQLSPVIRSQGSKLIPGKYRTNTENSQKTMDHLITVASAGVRGFSAVFTSLEESGRVLYASIKKAAVETVNYKYGDEAGDVTEEAMTAAGNTAQAYWNIKKLGAKAIAKRAAKDTSKAMLLDAEENANATATKSIEFGKER